MEGVFLFKSWFLNAPGLIHGGAYYRNFTVFSELSNLDSTPSPCRHCHTSVHSNITALSLSSLLHRRQFTSLTH